MVSIAKQLNEALLLISNVEEFLNDIPHITANLVLMLYVFLSFRNTIDFGIPLLNEAKPLSSSLRA